MMRLIATLLLCCAPLVCHGQEFMPHPRARITVDQWQAYFDEVSSKHAESRQAFPEQLLVVFHDAKTRTSYAFTQAGHAAHPAWVTRQPVEDSAGVKIRQIGYFAGDEAPFAKLFRDYQLVNQGIRETFKANSESAK